MDLRVQLENLAYKAQKTQTGVSCAGSSSRSNIGSLNYKHDYPVVKRYHNRFWSCFSRFESWPGSFPPNSLRMTWMRLYYPGKEVGQAFQPDKAQRQ